VVRRAVVIVRVKTGRGGNEIVSERSGTGGGWLIRRATNGKR